MQKHFGCFEEETETKQALLYFLGSSTTCIGAISILCVLSHTFWVWVLELENIRQKKIMKTQFWEYFLV